MKSADTALMNLSCVPVSDMHHCCVIGVFFHPMCARHSTVAACVCAGLSGSDILLSAVKRVTDSSKHPVGLRRVATW